VMISFLGSFCEIYAQTCCTRSVLIKYLFGVPQIGQTYCPRWSKIHELFKNKIFEQNDKVWVRRAEGARKVCPAGNCFKETKF
jgi:hypothetical protein